jgi:hypothetical protein
VASVRQNLRGLYQVVTLYQQLPEAGAVRATQKVYAFVQDDSEPAFFDADGYDVACYAYSLDMTR